ncbi:MAG: DUF898 domain-containing protein [Erysipelothrix sp.]|nr:DUF898 domain-containing protein [Erysipelothrix sp.]
MSNSYFDGGLLQLIVYRILGVLVTVFTLGICAPWAITMVESWKASHTVIDGRRLRFDGSAVSLFGQWIKWLLLTVITFGIYGFWVQIKMMQWVTKNTHFAD